MTPRSSKRTFVTIIYIMLFLIFGTSMYFLLKPDPSCSDNKRNQGEEGVDCGGPCRPCAQVIELEPLSVLGTEWIHDLDNKYDIVAKISNSNDSYGVAFFSFRAVARLEDGSEVAEERWNKGFILPGETKPVFVHGFELPQAPSNVTVEIKEGSDEWQKFSEFEEPNFIVNNSHYEERGGGSFDFSIATGTVINRSTTDFEAIYVHVTLRDSQGNLLAINSQEMNAVFAGQSRDYNMIFPHAFPGSVSDVSVFVETNPFDSDNYIKTHGTPDKWDETIYNKK